MSHHSHVQAVLERLLSHMHKDVLGTLVAIMSTKLTQRIKDGSVSSKKTVYNALHSIMFDYELVKSEEECHEQCNTIFDELVEAQIIRIGSDKDTQTNGTFQGSNATSLGLNDKMLEKNKQLGGLYLVYSVLFYFVITFVSLSCHKKNALYLCLLCHNTV